MKKLIAFYKSTARKEMQVTFQWRGVNRWGEAVCGHMDATHPLEVKAKLRQQAIVAHLIVKKSFMIRHNKRIKVHDICVLSQQLAAIVNTGISLIKSLELIEHNQTNRRMQQLLASIRYQIESGLTFAEALNQHPRLFNQLFCNLVAVGEESGTLAMMLKKIAIHQEKLAMIKQQIKKALFYPSFVMIIASLITLGLLIAVVPQFETLFNNFHAQLPVSTWLVIQLSHGLKTRWQMLGVFIISSISCYYLTGFYSHRFKLARDQCLLKLPIIGNLIQQIILARFASALAITYTAGLPLVDALQSVASITGNTLYTRSILQMRAAISNGEQMFSQQQEQLFPRQVMQMIQLGEETGTVNDMLQHIANYYENAIEYRIQTISSILEPMIMALLGILIGGLIIALYLPILKLGSLV